jgi:hypothetical protein
LDDKQLVKVARSMFNLTPSDLITVDQLNCVLKPKYDTTKALPQRPWQKAIIDVCGGSSISGLSR